MIHRPAARWSMRTAGLIALTLLLAACGFHLRGQVALSPQMARTYISGIGSGSTLSRALAEALRANGVRVVGSAQDASAVLQVVSFGSSSSVLSRTADGQVSGYRLVSVLVFSVHATAGDWKLPEQRLQAQREYSYSDSQVLGKTYEADQLREDMARQLANLVMLRLQAQAGR